MCGIFGITGHEDAARLSYLGLYALQHRGEESAGIVANNGKQVRSHRAMGLVADVFKENNIRSLRGDLAVGHVRYSTTGSSNPKNVQPFLVSHRKGHIAIAHNGNLTNTLTLRHNLEEEGAIFQTTMDSEIIAHLLTRSRSKSLQENIVNALSQLAGAFALVLMYDNLLIGVRDPRGFRPLCLGRLDGAYVLASETCALDLIQARYIRDVEPGEIVFIDREGTVYNHSDNSSPQAKLETVYNIPLKQPQAKLETVYNIPLKQPQAKLGVKSIKPFPPVEHSLCIFEYIYFARPDSNIFGKSVYLTRKNLGRQLAREYPAQCDFVMPVPDSGSSAAVGYAEEAKLPAEIGMIRNHYVGRTFIQPSQGIRDFRVRVKLNPIKDALKDKTIAIIEDSIVRGTTSRSRVKTLREAGASRIHMRISCPPIKFPCFFGIDFPTKKELIAARHSIDWIKDFIGVDSLNYLSLAGMLQSMPLAKEKFCTACFNGDYPLNPPKRLSKKMLERKQR